MKRLVHCIAITIIVAGLLSSSGCSYLNARGRDALDIVDVGVTVTDKWTPDFGLYFDFFSITPVGFSTVDGKVLGIGNRKIGLLDYEDHSWGVLLWGSEKKGTGAFNPDDPRQARNDIDEASGHPRYNMGVVRMALQNNLPPRLQFIECDRILHLGWIGIHATIRPFDLVDFILGWTTFDLMGDDDVIPPSKVKDNE